MNGPAPTNPPSGAYDLWTRLSTLLGRDLINVRSLVRAATQSFEALRIQTDEEMLGGRAPASRRPPHSVFLCAEIPVSATLLAYLARLGVLVRECIGRAGNVAFTDTKTQHCTALVLARADVPFGDATLAHYRESVAPLLSVSPFTLYLREPALMPDGGLVLRAETYAPSLYSIRTTWDADREREISIIHSTFGYVDCGDTARLRALAVRLEGLPSPKYSVRVRVMRLATSAGSRVTFASNPLPLADGGAEQRSDRRLAARLLACRRLVRGIRLDRDLRGVLMEEAFSALEYPPGPAAYLAAERLLEALDRSM